MLRFEHLPLGNRIESMIDPGAHQRCPSIDASISTPLICVKLDAAGYRATIGGRDLALTAVEFQLLRVLVEHPGRIYTRDQLMDAMYRDERVVADRTVDSHVKKIRRKIAAVLPDREILHSVYGVGYKYEW